MTRRERLRRCYFNQEIDRPAVYSRTGFPADDPSYDRLKAYLHSQTALKSIWSSSVIESKYPIESSVECYSEDFERRIEVLHTPDGELRRSSLVSLKGQPGLHETFFINSREEAEKYLSLPMPAVDGDVSSFFDASAEIGDRGIAEAKVGFNAAGYVAELCGSHNFALLSATDRDILDCLCERQMKIILDRTKFLIARNIGPFFSLLGQEYIVPPLHGLKDFRDFNVKYDKPIIDLIHEAGGRVHIHSHGSVGKVFQEFIDMGTDVFHPFEAPPLGDILPGEAKELARDRMCLEGNIQIHRMYEVTPEEIRNETEQLAAAAFDDNKGLIVCPTASPYIRGKGEECFPQYEAMIEAVLEWK